MLRPGWTNRSPGDPQSSRNGADQRGSGVLRLAERQQRRRHEVVLHGYFHMPSAEAQEDGGTPWLRSIILLGEGEFYDLPESDATLPARKRRSASLRELACLARGFIAPGLASWALKPRRAVRRAGFEYTTRFALSRISSLVGRPFRTASSGVCVAGWRRVLSLCWNALAGAQALSCAAPAHWPASGGLAARRGSAAGFGIDARRACRLARR